MLTNDRHDKSCSCDLASNVVRLRSYMEPTEVRLRAAAAFSPPLAGERRHVGFLLPRAAVLSIASTALLFCCFTGRVASIPGGLLLGRQQNRPFGLFGGKESFCLLGFALSP